MREYGLVMETAILVGSFAIPIVATQVLVHLAIGWIGRKSCSRYGIPLVVIAYALGVAAELHGTAGSERLAKWLLVGCVECLLVALVLMVVDLCRLAWRFCDPG